MLKLSIVNRAGDRAMVQVPDGISIMEAIRDNDFDDMLAMCGGSCSCATCHVHVAPDFMDKLPPMSEDENDLLDGSLHRDEFSRLACQLKMSPLLDGIEVRIAEEG